ncbi:hypothetical protein DFH07DRAFT_52434 [Mycena maculata]|uniref:Uncharacterized protein n=1 Tax=Mycena maculata TaxID=230809 RepID=A0AAD7IH31_9AGAR|nr:hypothetical protein DFH07DRAFT_52434 [Mycena maculata]
MPKMCKEAAPQPPTSIVYVEELVESIPPPPRNVPQKRSTAVAEFIDLTDSPEARRPRRSRAQIDFEDSPPPSTPSRSASTISTVEVIDLSSDSPHSVVLELPDPPIPSPPVSPTATVLRPMDVDRSPASPGRTMTRSPTMSEIGLPDTPTRPQSPGIDFPSMKIDDTDQKPLSWLFGNLAVSDPVAPRPLPRPQGGSLGPAWIRESAEASSYMLVLDRYIEKQKRVKPLSRRKPEKTRFIGDSREPFIVLPFLKEHSSLI